MQNANYVTASLQLVVPEPCRPALEHWCQLLIMLLLFTTYYCDGSLVWKFAGANPNRSPNCWPLASRSDDPLDICVQFPFSGQFLPRDVYIQRLCYDLMSVCSSVCHKPVFYQNGWTYLAVFDTGYFWQFILCYTLLCGISSISNNKATSLCNLLPA